MKYLCLAYIDEKQVSLLPGSELDALVKETYAYFEELQESGRLVSAERLQPTQTATTVRVRNGRLSITDGPYAETKEQLAGLFVIEARDLNEAIHLASKANLARIGCVEVRPIEDSALRPRSKW